jgi:hypothetical protein
MILGIVSISCFTGPPIGGQLIALRDGDYLYAQLFGGFTMLAGGAAYLTSAVLKNRALKRQQSQV